MRNVRTVILAAVSRRDLYYVSENESFCFGQKTLVRHGTDPGTARHGNIWHGTDHEGTARKSAASRQGRNGRVFNKARNSEISDT